MTEMRKVPVKSSPPNIPTLSFFIYQTPFICHFPGEPGLAGFIGARIMEVVVTIGAVRRQSNCQYQQTNTQLFTYQMPFLSPNQQCQSTEGIRKVGYAV